MNILGPVCRSVRDLNHGYVTKEQNITIKVIGFKTSDADHHINRGSYMSAHNLLNLLNKMGKR